MGKGPIASLGCGKYSPPRREIPHGPLTICQLGDRLRKKTAWLTARRLASFLPFSSSECVVFRLTLFTIVLTLTAPEASLLCKLWCPSSTAAAIECHHHDQAPTETVQGDGCHLPAVSAFSFIREEGSRSVLNTDAAHAVRIPRYRLAPPASELRPVEHASRPRALERRPIETTLRL